MRFIEAYSHLHAHISQVQLPTALPILGQELVPFSWIICCVLGLRPDLSTVHTVESVYTIAPTLRMLESPARVCAIPYTEITVNALHNSCTLQAKLFMIPKLAGCVSQAPFLTNFTGRNEKQLGKNYRGHVKIAVHEDNSPVAWRPDPATGTAVIIVGLTVT